MAPLGPHMYVLLLLCFALLWSPPTPPSLLTPCPANLCENCLHFTNFFKELGNMLDCWKKITWQVMGFKRSDFCWFTFFLRGLVQSYSNSGRKFLVYLDSGSGTLSSGISPGQMVGVIISRLPTRVSISIFPVIPRGYPLSIMGQLQIRFLPVLSVE